ncbi:hypothetical protein ACFODL_05900 [Phenylobacterium terrae]|uniref:Uncharacterized protein n=1 Tax=Phenylobacterium terrae TaxID=2665495 RepID=A0ABW4N670_9CAUL
MKKYLIAASAIAMGVAMSSAALADDTTANGAGNDNALSLLSNNDINSNNTDDNSSDIQDNTLNLLSGNSSDDDLNGSFNEDNDIVAVGNGNEDNDNVAVGSFNGNGDTSNDNDVSNDNDTYTTVEVDVEVDIDASTTYEDSVVSSQTLNASVTGATFEDAGLQLVDDQGDLNTGNIRQENDAFRGFTGIATIAMDTSIGSVNQAATNVTAGSEISFD